MGGRHAESIYFHRVLYGDAFSEEFNGKLVTITEQFVWSKEKKIANRAVFAIMEADDVIKHRLCL